jgi:hypothetical protein
VDVRHLAPQIEEAEPADLEPIDEPDEGIDNETPVDDEAELAEEAVDADE